MDEGNVTRLRTTQRAVTPLPENVMARVLEGTLTFDEAWAELSPAHGEQAEADR